MAKQKPTKKVVSKKHLARQQREAKQTRLITIIAIALGVVILGLVLYGVIDQTIIRPRTPVARVGETKITVREFESYVQYSRAQMLNQSYQYYTYHLQFGEFGGNFLQTAQSIVMELSQPTTLGRSILDEMINNRIIAEEAAKRGITVSEAEIDEALQSAFGFFPNGTPAPAATEIIQPTPTYSETQLALISTPTTVASEAETTQTDLTPTLSSTTSNTGETESETEGNIPTESEETEETALNLPEAAIESTPEATPTITLTPTPYTSEVFGKNIKEFNDLYSIYNFDINDLREIFKEQLLREKLVEAIELDVAQTKNEVWARHILVETTEEANEVLSRLNEGESFYDLAAIYSIDESNKNRGGDLGWFDENTMVPEFTAAAFALSEGEISQPVETSFGFHIIQVVGKRASQVSPTELSQQKQQAFSDWLNEQRDNRADIEIFDGWEQYVPTTPEVPQQYLTELYSQPQ